MLTGAAGIAALEGALRGLSSAVPNADEGGGSVTPARARMGGGSGDRCASGASIASVPPHELQRTVPIGLYQSQRPQTMPSSNSIRAAEGSKKARAATHQMMFRRFFESQKPLAPTSLKTMCWHVRGSI